MNKFNFKSAIIIFSTLFLALVAVLWSWNTLSELFGWPHAQFKHAVAAVSIVLLGKWIATAKWKHHGNNNCDHTPTHKIA